MQLLPGGGIAVLATIGRGAFGTGSFSCVLAHCGGCLVAILRGFFASVGGLLVFAVGSGDWAVILWGLYTFLIFSNF